MAASIILTLVLIWVLLSAFIVVVVCMASAKMSRLEEGPESGPVPQRVVTAKPRDWEYAGNTG
jgi:hypothetical protein